MRRIRRAPEDAPDGEYAGVDASADGDGDGDVGSRCWLGVGGRGRTGPDGRVGGSVDAVGAVGSRRRSRARWRRRRRGWSRRSVSMVRRRRSWSLRRRTRLRCRTPSIRSVLSMTCPRAALTVTVTAELADGYVWAGLAAPWTLTDPDDPTSPATMEMSWPSWRARWFPWCRRWSRPSASTVRRQR